MRIGVLDTVRWLALGLALVGAPAIGHAEEPTPPDVIPAKARALAQRGRAYHDAGDYGNAIISFKEAYVMAPSPGLLFNLAQAYRLQGNCDDATLMYRRYLATSPSVEGKRIAEARLTSSARCAHDAQRPAERDGHPPIEIETSRESGSLFATSPGAVRGQREKTVGIGLGLAGGLGLSVALYFALRAHDATATVERGYASGARWQDLASADARGESSATIAKAFGIGGGVAIVGGVALYLLGARTERNAVASVRIAPLSVSRAYGGSQVSIAWQF